MVFKALGRTTGKSTLFIDGTDSTASFRQDWKWLQSGEPEAIESVSVELTTLDNLLEEFGVPAYCKIDVEGFEEEVLSTLTKPIKYISFEFQKDGIERSFTCIDLVEKLAPYQFRFIAMNETDWQCPWTDSESIKRLLASENLPEVGDVFAWHDGHL